MKNWEKNEQARLRRLASGLARNKDSTPAAKPQLRMLEGDETNFLKLAAALKIIMARSIRESDIPRAKELLYGYLLGFLKVFTVDFLY